VPTLLEAADSRHLIADTAAFHGLTMEDQDWAVEADSIDGFSSLPDRLVRNLITEESGRPRTNLLLDQPLDRHREGRHQPVPAEAGRRRRSRVGPSCGVHQLLADALGLIYDPSVARVPPIGHLIRTSNEIALATADIDVLHDLVHQRAAATAAAFGAVSGPVPISPVTAYALRRTGRLDRWWEIVAELRDRSTRYRRIRARLQPQLFIGDIAALTRLGAELDGSAAELSDARVDASLGIATSAANAGATLIAGPPAAFAGPVLQMIKLVLGRPSRSAVAALRRRLRPELRLFHDIAQAATACSQLHNEIRLLWNVAPLPDSIHELNKIHNRVRNLTRP
jgi:hypothetical protein